MDKKFCSYAIGIDRSSGYKSLLIAPDGYLIKPGDKVGTDRGTYFITYSRSHVTDEYPEVLALKAAMGPEPIKIRKKLLEEIFNWEESENDVDG